MMFTCIAIVISTSDRIIMLILMLMNMYCDESNYTYYN